MSGTDGSWDCRVCQCRNTRHRATCTACHMPREDPVLKAIRQFSAERAARQEVVARELATKSLPRHLNWLIEHPRLLVLYWRLRPRKRPTLQIYSDSGEVFVNCVGHCHEGAIYVPDIGPMGDSQHRSIAEAVESGRLWRYDESREGFICPGCDPKFGEVPD